MAKYKNVHYNTVCVDHAGKPTVYPSGAIFDGNPRHRDIKRLVRQKKIRELTWMESGTDASVASESDEEETSKKSKKTSKKKKSSKKKSSDSKDKK